MAKLLPPSTSSVSLDESGFMIQLSLRGDGRRQGVYHIVVKRKFYDIGRCGLTLVAYNQALVNV